MNLSGLWKVKLNDNEEYNAYMPGTLDRNKIGHKDEIKNQWHPADGIGEVSSSNLLLNHRDVITTRFTRKYTFEGEAVYSREFSWKSDNVNERVFLEVERTRKLSAKINGKSVEPYTHGTISTSYVYELTNYLTDNNSLELVCDNSYQGWPHDAIVYSSAATDETQTNWNGLLGDLLLRREMATFISAVRVYPKGKTISISIDLDSTTSYKGIIAINSSALANIIKQEVSVEKGQKTILIENQKLVSDVRLWDEFEGNLYELTVSADGLESKAVSFGIRDFSANDGVIKLNGRKIFLRSETNCCVFPETGHMPLSVSEWANIIEVYKSYGVNMIRFHSHCPPKAAFIAADIAGMLIQPELSHWNPKNAFEDDESWSYYKLEVEQILLAYANHPSFVMLTLGNELHAGELGINRMTELLDIMKKIDTTRLYANGSNVFYGAKGADQSSDFFTGSNYYKLHLRGTSAGMIGHINENYPNAKTNFDNEMKEIRKEYQYPVFGFEVGQFESLPDFDELDEFEGISEPANYKLIKKYAESRGFIKDWKKRVEATGELARIAYREEVEAALRTKECSGISLLGLQDFPGQGTALVGMLNSHLKPKPFDFAKPDNFKKFFCEALPLALMDKYTYTNNENLTAEIAFANYSKRDISAPVLFEVYNGKMKVLSGSLPEGVFYKGELSTIGSIDISLSTITKASKLILKINIEDYCNEYKFWVYPTEKHEKPDSILIAMTLKEAEVALNEGKTVLLSPKSDMEHLPGSVQSQFTTDFWSVGTFASQSGCMGCLLDPEHPVFKGFPTEFHTNWQWWPMTNGRAMITPAEIDPLITVMDCYARMRKMSFLFECRVGAGKLMVSSMGLLEKQQYPEARALTGSILSYMASEEFNPNQTLGIETLSKIIAI